MIEKFLPFNLGPMVIPSSSSVPSGFGAKTGSDG